MENKEHQLHIGRLLNEKGILVEAGYSFSLCKIYNSKLIKKHKRRLKEWDYYYFGNDKHAIALVIGDLQYIGQFGIVYFDFENKKLIDKSKLLLFPKGKLNLPCNSSTSYRYQNKNDVIELKILSDKKREIIVHCENIENNNLDIDVILSKTCNDTMVIATPFKKKGYFYYNQKINNFSVKGKVMLGNIDLNKDNDFMGVLDWGRGIWTYDNTWKWCSINARNGDDFIGFNLGNGFGDLSKSGENMFFLNDKAYKLPQIDIHFTRDKKGNLDPTGSVMFSSRENDKLEMIFTPIFNRHVKINALVLYQLTDQMFGYFSGTVKYDNKEYSFHNLFGFIERVHNRW